jgi:hypothetical protein
MQYDVSKGIPVMYGLRGSRTLDMNPFSVIAPTVQVDSRPKVKRFNAAQAS